MILGRQAILEAIESGDIVVNPLDHKNIGPNSIDLHLGHELYVLRGPYKHISYEASNAAFAARKKPSDCITDYLSDMADPQQTSGYYDANVLDMEHRPTKHLLPLVSGVAGKKGWMLLPGFVYLGATFEHTETRRHVPYLDGRSSLARYGVFAHCTAGRGDVGFAGRWTVELVAAQPCVVYPRSRIFQIAYHEVTGYGGAYGEVGNGSGRYQHDSKPQESRYIVGREEE